MKPKMKSTILKMTLHYTSVVLLLMLFQFTAFGQRQLHIRDQNFNYEYAFKSAIHQATFKEYNYLLYEDFYSEFMRINHKLKIINKVYKNAYDKMESNSLKLSNQTFFDYDSSGYLIKKRIENYSNTLDTIITIYTYEYNESKDEIRITMRKDSIEFITLYCFDKANNLLNQILNFNLHGNSSTSFQYDHNLMPKAVISDGNVSNIEISKWYGELEYIQYQFNVLNLQKKFRRALYKSSRNTEDSSIDNCYTIEITNKVNNRSSSHYINICYDTLFIAYKLNNTLWNEQKLYVFDKKGNITFYNAWQSQLMHGIEGHSYDAKRKIMILDATGKLEGSYYKLIRNRRGWKTTGYFMNFEEREGEIIYRKNMIQQKGKDYIIQYFFT